MEQPKTILVLDYDGTLHDSSAVYEPAFRKVMEEISALDWIERREYTSEEIRYWVGFSATEMWKLFQPKLSEERKQIAGKRIGQYMLEYIRAGRGRLYPQTEEVLLQLSKKYELLFFSNCDEAYLEAHRQAFGLNRFFTSFYCTGSYGFGQKEEVFAEHIYRPERSYIVVGDRNKDLALAKACGLPCVGCLYGFGSKEELKEADCLITDICLLEQAVDSLNR